jgi:hypothetical protein
LAAESVLLFAGRAAGGRQRALLLGRQVAVDEAFRGVEVLVEDASGIAPALLGTRVGQSRLPQAQQFGLEVGGLLEVDRRRRQLHRAAIGVQNGGLARDAEIGDTIDDGSGGGATAAVTNVQPSIILNYIIKT